MTMKICIDERAYQGSAAEIMEQLRQQTFDPTEYPDMAWLDQLEDAIFGPRDSAPKQPLAEAKSGKKTASKKKLSRQER